MSATIIDGGPAGPDEVGGQYRNRILTDRAVWWEALGGKQGVISGGDVAKVAGQMAVSVTAIKAAIEERDTLGNTGTRRGYVVWSDADQTATIGPASASTRVDALVVAFCDLAAGAGAFGTETSAVGGQLVVVPGVSGVTTARTDADINDAVGSGGWTRLADITVESTDTEIQEVNIADRATRLTKSATDGAVSAVTTDANGNAVVPHTLGVTPVSVTVANGAGNAASIIEIVGGGLNATEIMFHVTDQNGTNRANASVFINWIAHARVPL